MAVRNRRAKKIKRRRASKTAARRKALKEWSQQIRARDGCCVVCGSTKYNQAHHLLPKAYYGALQYHLMNGVTLCAGHHAMGKLSAEQNGIWFSRWLQTNRPEQYAWVLAQLDAPETEKSETPKKEVA